MQFKSVEAYLEALKQDPSLAMIPLGMVAEWKGISRSAVADQIKTGRLEGMAVKGRRKTWRGVTPKALFAQAEAVESGQREQRRLVLRVLSKAAAEGRLITYGEVMAPVGMAPSNPRHRAAIGNLLSDLSRDSLQRHGFLLSAIVVQKGSRRPNAQFFTLARELGSQPDGEEPDAFWRGQCDKVFASFRVTTPTEIAE
ncbi:MAG: hypothetical protein NVV74_12755 [Magnetospirillum sp.]|nr:hypothetical protein [Magnetospirillum sp.]